MPRKAPRPLKPGFPDASELALELLSQMLQFSPNQRISAAQALRHPYLAELHEEESELSHTEPCSRTSQAYVSA